MPSPVVPDCACTSRVLLDQIADKWSIYVLAVLCDGPLRFNEIRRRIGGVTQKALTQALRRLERNGIVSRRVLPTSPVSVEYAITPLGRTLRTPFEALRAWTMTHAESVTAAQRRYDSGSSEPADEILAAAE